jgi:hypothetical protein
MRGNYPKDNAEAGQNLVTIKRTTRNIKTNFISIDQLIHAGANPNNIVVIDIVWRDRSA